MVWRTRAQGGRIVAVGTTVVRALEQAAARDGVVRAGEGVATERIKKNITEDDQKRLVERYVQQLKG